MSEWKQIIFRENLYGTLLTSLVSTQQLRESLYIFFTNDRSFILSRTLPISPCFFVWNGCERIFHHTVGVHWSVIRLKHYCLLLCIVPSELSLQKRNLLWRWGGVNGRLENERCFPEDTLVQRESRLPRDVAKPREFTLLWFWGFCFRAGRP